MHSVGSSRVTCLPNQGFRRWLTTGWVLLVIGAAVVLVGALLPEPGSLTSENFVLGAAQTNAEMVSASHDDLGNARASVNGGRRNASDTAIAFEPAPGRAARADHDNPVATSIPVGSRGALHAGDRSPIAVSNHRDLRLDLMEMTARRWRRAVAPRGSCLC
jgi:hypothetical protein